MLKTIFKNLYLDYLTILEFRIISQIFYKKIFNEKPDFSAPRQI